MAVLNDEDKLRTPTVQDILTEILSEQEWGVVDWVEVWRCWVCSSLDTSDPRVTGDCPGPGHVTRLVTLPTQVSRDTGHVTRHT